MITWGSFNMKGIYFDIACQTCVCMFIYRKKANSKYAIKFGDKGRATKIVYLKIALLHATQE